MLKEKTFEFDELSNWLAIHPNITNVSILDGSLIVKYETSDELIGMEGKQYQVMTEDGDLHEGTVVDGEVQGDSAVATHGIESSELRIES